MEININPPSIRAKLRLKSTRVREVIIQWAGSERVDELINRNKYSLISEDKEWIIINLSKE